MVINKSKLFVCFFLIKTANFALGQSLQELQQLKAEYEKFKEDKTQLIFPGTQPTDFDPNTGTPNSASLTPFTLGKRVADSADVSLPHFGYNFFTKRDTVSFWENLPIPNDYILGPGDEVVVSIWGETEFRLDYKISREGTIYDDKAGILNLTGKTLNEAEYYLKTQFGRVYSTLNGKNPRTFMTVTLGDLRSININIVGEVFYPGVYPVHPFSNVITALIQAGGVDTTGSLRNIILKRIDKENVHLDLYDYLLNGNISNNLQLRNQDIIIIPPRESTITIDSSVVRPGIYESKPGETVNQLLDYAGGLKPNASTLIGLKRIVAPNKRDLKKSNIENFYIDYLDKNSTIVQNGDSLIVRNIFYNLKQVEIIGQVKRPGFYPFYDGMTLMNLISLGGGFSDSTFLKSIYQKSGEIVRRNPSSPYEKVISINIEKILLNNDDIPLQNLDKFVVHANRNFFEKKNVQILGEVNIPGSYPLISNKETLNSLINRAGGLTLKALDNGVSIYRDKKYVDAGLSKQPINQQQVFARNNQEEVETRSNLMRAELDNSKIYEADNEWVRVAWKNKDVRLMPGDSIVIKEATKTVNIDGEIYNPGLIEFQKGKSLRYYVDSAGGITKAGDKKDIIVIYANGVVVPKKFMSSPKIMDGATIFVNQKEIQEPFNLTEFSSTILSIVSTTVTILVLSQQLNTN